MLEKMTSTFYNNVKKTAKTLKKTLNIPHSQALELASQQAGYPNFYALDKAYKSKAFFQVDYIQDVRNILIDFASSEYSNNIIDERTLMLSDYPKGSEDIHSIVRSKLLEVFDHGINENERNNNDWIVLNWCFCKETVKELGYVLIKKDNIEDKIKGNLLVSMGHFFRSAADSYQSQRPIHPNFIIYVSDWVRSLTIDKESIPTLLEIYPENENNGIAKGSSYWTNIQ